MNKKLWLIIIFVLFSLLGFFLFKNPTFPPEITFKEVEEEAKLPPKVPIVKEIQLENLIVKESPMKNDLKKAKINVEKRKSECEKNSKELFKKNVRLLK